MKFYRSGHDFFFLQCRIKSYFTELIAWRRCFQLRNFVTCLPVDCCRMQPPFHKLFSSFFERDIRHPLTAASRAERRGALLTCAQGAAVRDGKIRNIIII